MEESYEQKSAQIRNLANAPAEKVVNHLTQLHNVLDSSSPNLAPHVYAAANNAIQYLNQQLPPSPETFIQGNQKPMVSKAQETDWLETYDVVNDPKRIFGHINDGTLTSNHLQAVQSVYPDIYKQISVEIMEELGKRKDEADHLPYPRRLMVSKFLNQPLDGTMTFSAIQAIMNANSTATSSQNQAPKKARSQRATSVELKQANKVADLYKTTDQARQSEKVES
jgi:hypothetical protein